MRFAPPSSKRDSRLARTLNDAVRHGGSRVSLQKFTLQVTGPQIIHCGSCENAVRRAVTQLPGVRQVAASRRTQHIELTLDTNRTTLEGVREHLSWMGYLARETAAQGAPSRHLGGES